MFSFFVICVLSLSYHTVLSVYFSLVVTCWERTDLLALLYVMVLVFYHFLIRCPGLGVVLGYINS